MADLQQRRRRSASADAEAQEEALQQLAKELGDQEVRSLPELKDETEIPDEELEVREKTTMEKTMVETPRALAPNVESALFSPAQLATLEAGQIKAAHLYGGPKVLQGLPTGSQEQVPDLPRPKFLEDEKAREMALLSTATGSPSPDGPGRDDGKGGWWRTHDADALRSLPREPQAERGHAWCGR